MTDRILHQFLVPLPPDPLDYRPISYPNQVSCKTPATIHVLPGSLRIVGTNAVFLALVNAPAPAPEIPFENSPELVQDPKEIERQFIWRRLGDTCHDSEQWIGYVIINTGPLSLLMVAKERTFASFKFDKC